MAEVKTFANYPRKFNYGKASIVEKANQKINFGKYKGKKLGEVVLGDPQYVQWLSKNCQFDVMRQCAEDVYQQVAHIQGMFEPVAGPREQVPTTFPFGKYKGKTFEWVVENDRNYAEWAANNMNNAAIKKAVQEALEEAEDDDDEDEMTVHVPKDDEYDGMI